MKQHKFDVEHILKAYGRTMQLEEKEKKTQFKAFLQPLRYKNKMYLSAVSTELRYDSSRKYLLIAPASVDLGNADGYAAVITDGKNKYVADRTEQIYFGDNPLYTWAVVSAL